jgi:acyl-homoserine lactone acylase PvdQ
MKARDLASFMAALELKANSTNNTIYADADGNIAFQPPQFIPRREDRFDFRQPVDGTDPATDWRGVHALDEAPGLRNPASGWMQNTTTGRTPPPASTARNARTTRVTWTPSARTRAAYTRSCCFGASSRRWRGRWRWNRSFDRGWLPCGAGRYLAGALTRRCT